MAAVVSVAVLVVVMILILVVIAVIILVAAIVVIIVVVAIIVTIVVAIFIAIAIFVAIAVAIAIRLAWHIIKMYRIVAHRGSCPKSDRHLNLDLLTDDEFENMIVLAGAEISIGDNPGRTVAFGCNLADLRHPFDGNRKAYIQFFCFNSGTN